MLWLQLSSKSCLRVPRLSKLDWKAAGVGMPDPNNGFSMPRLTSLGVVQTNRRPVSHLCAKQGILMSDLFWLGVLPPPPRPPLSDINLLESWHLSYPPWLWLLCVYAWSRPAGSCSAQSYVGIRRPCLHCRLPHKTFLRALVACALLWLMPALRCR